MNALECLLRAEKRVSKTGLGKVHDLWVEKGMWDINEKNLMNQIRMIQWLGNKYRNRNNQEKNRKQRKG